MKRFVFISSIKVYGEAPSGVMNESTPLTPESPYARTKAEGERIVLDAVDLQPVVLRLCPVFGRGDKGNVRTMARAIRRRRFLVPGDGSTRKSLVHVSTVAEVVRAVCASSATGVFVVADREAASIRELADAIAASLRRRPAFSVPRSMLRRTASLVACAANAVGVHTAISEALIDKAMTSSVCDPSLAERTFGVSCHVDLAWAIRDEIDWLRTSGLL